MKPYKYIERYINRAFYAPKPNLTKLYLILISTATLSVSAYSAPTHFSDSIQTKSPGNISADKKIIGKVVNQTTGEVLSGVSVRIKGSDVGTSTDDQGFFKLPLVTGQATLIISYVGFANKEVAITNKGTLNITLRPEAKGLEGVVVVGYGKQKKSDVTGSITTIDQKTLANRPITNSTQALQGAPGVYVNQTNGRPGADAATIRIRGIGTLNNSNPLVLVDGVEYSLGAINPNDIETITVLKDAASSAIYGNRAANGVILVTTKKGQKDKFQVNYNYYKGVQSSTFTPKVVSNAVGYMEGKNRALANEGKPAEYTQALIEDYKAGTDPYIYSNTDWFDIMYRNAPIEEHNLRFSGGNDKTTFSLSLGYLNQDGILLNTWAKRYTVNLNVASEISTKLKVGANISGTVWNNRESSYTSDEANGEGGLMGLIYRGLPMQVPLTKEGAYADQWFRVPGHNFFRNPYALSYEGFRKDGSYRTLANIFAEYQLPYNIKYKVTAAANIFYDIEKFFNPQVNLTNPKTGDVAMMGNIPIRNARNTSSTAVNLTNFHTINWEQRFKEHKIAALAGFSVEQFNNGSLSASNQGFLDNSLTELNAGSVATLASGTSSDSKLLSYFSRVNYSFQNKYFAEANFRYDGSSRFAQGNRLGFFPSFSAGWLISEEDFLKNNSAISNLKLRASWGKLGNQQISLYSYVDAISLGYNYSFNGTVVGGAATSQLTDPNITWETTTMSNVGVDLDLFKNRLSAELDVFDKRTTNILRQVSVPGQVGDLTGPYRNIGSVSNKGVEVTLNYRDKIGAFTYSIGSNITYVNNKVLDIKGNKYYSGTTITTEGAPINSFFGLVAEGIFQSDKEVQAHAFQSTTTKPGDIIYKDVDGNKIINDADRVIIGSSIPKYTYSFTLGAGYKGLQLTAFFQGVQDVSTYTYGNLAQPYKNGAGVTEDWLTNSWTPENPTARLPRLTTSTGYPQNFQTSSFWLQDASYLRLKNVQLSYRVPQKLMPQFTVFVNAQNYLTFSKFKLGDPERQVTRGDIIEYPNAKSITAGVNVTF
jgi:TonB-dependent starch-binding outer membrane protein SusC